MYIRLGYSPSMTLSAAAPGSRALLTLERESGEDDLY
jgi:hypothetical protein